MTLLENVVLAERAEADLAALDRATRLRVVAAIQRMVLTNAGSIRFSRPAGHKQTTFPRSRYAQNFAE